MKHRSNAIMTSYAAVTSFHRAGYETYGRTMVETFDRHWPGAVRLIAYAEGFQPRAPSPRVAVEDLLAVSPELVAFRERHKDNRYAHGASRLPFRIIVQWHKRRVKLRRVLPKDSYRWQAVRFAHKPFAIFAAAEEGAADVLFWLDSDMVMKADLPEDALATMMPADAMLSCIRRPKFTDCCVIGFNMRHPRTAAFLDAFRSLYVTDRLFRYPEYHDSYLFDVVRERFEREGARIHDLSEGAGRDHGHVFDHCRLGLWMDHLKGERKNGGGAADA